MVVSSHAVIFVYVNHGLVGQFSRGEYSTGAIDSVAVKAVLYRFRVNGNTIKGSDLSLTTVQPPRGGLRTCGRL